MPHRSYLLEMTARDSFRPVVFPLAGVVVGRAGAGDASRCRHLWCEVGRGFWTEREDWNDARWREHLAAPHVWFAIATCDCQDIGFFELEDDNGDVELEGFGLLPAWRGRQLGGGLLSAAVEQAYALGGTRIWLNTATDDHPHALSNYQRRGFRIYHEEALRHPMPEPLTSELSRLPAAKTPVRPRWSCR